MNNLNSCLKEVILNSINNHKLARINCLQNIFTKLAESETDNNCFERQVIHLHR